MFLNHKKFDPSASVSEIVIQDYRTAGIFMKYGIEYCCGGKFPLDMVCLSRGLEPGALLEELKQATREVRLPADPGYRDWPIDFLIDYIIHLHHRYIRQAVPAIGEHLTEFIREHERKIPELKALGEMYEKLAAEILPHLKDEEETVFPYIRQLAHAFNNREPYAVLLVRTLRKPLRKMIDDEHEKMAWLLMQLRKCTNNYTPPEKACVNHRVVFSRLNELDQDLSQHLYLETDILFPRTLEMERELLDTPAL
jgi:regulator of cell morphogenesis and NO signaling